MGVMPHPTDLLTEADLVALVGGGLIGDEVGPMRGRPLVAVILHDAVQDQRMAPLVRNLPCVTVGVADQAFVGPEGFDLYLCGDADASEPWVPCAGSTEPVVAGLAAAVSDHPVAALVLVQLLRVAPALDVAGGLATESLAYATLQSGADHQRWLAGQAARREGQAHREGRDGGERQAESDPVVASRRAGRLRITLNRPQVRNAYNAAMRDALIEVLRVAAADPDVVEVVIEGAGPDFCSGGDLDEFGTSHDPSVAHAVRSTRHAGAALAVIANRCSVLVHGACVGAGTELAAFADRVVAAPDTVFRLPELSMGLVPGAGGTVSVPRRIGSSRTAWLALSGDGLSADRALAWGLVDDIDDDTDTDTDTDTDADADADAGGAASLAVGTAIPVPDPPGVDRATALDGG
jgi:enoyl-CoA hydratase/carnithine racemase